MDIGIGRPRRSSSSVTVRCDAAVNSLTRAEFARTVGIATLSPVWIADRCRFTAMPMELTPPSLSPELRACPDTAHHHGRAEQVVPGLDGLLVRDRRWQHVVRVQRLQVSHEQLAQYCPAYRAGTGQAATSRAAPGCPGGSRGPHVPAFELGQMHRLVQFLGQLVQERACLGAQAVGPICRSTAPSR